MNRIIAALVVAVSPLAVLALDAFAIKDIRVEGLQRIAAGTVFNYLPVKVGDTLTESGAQEAIKALYRTGFFKDVRLERQGEILIVSVVERPSIASFRISGTREFPQDDLKKGLKETGLSEGRIFNRSLLDRVEQELRAQYFSRGFYAVSIKPTVTPLERNRVDIDIAVIEGPPARIREISIVGNKAFAADDLRDLFTLGPASWWALFSSRDQYSKQKLAGDLERLRNYYQDRGYLEFNIESTQVQITPDKEDIYVTVNVTEGEQYKITDYKLAGKYAASEDDLRALITLVPGAVFSRKQITESTKAISDRLANDGYAFANVNAVPEVNKDARTVSFTFFVDPGKRTYVRRVNFAGNVATHDEVMRREFRQLEGGWYSAEKIRRSRERLQRLGFFEDVNIETPAVPGASDQVDINVSVKERSTGSLTLGVGYSDSGLLLNAAVTESNLFGSGNELSFRIDNSSASESYSVRFVDPYYTPGGVSRGFSLYANTLDTSQLNTAAYNTKTVGAGVFWGIPLSEYHRLNLGLDFESIAIETRPESPQAAKDFVALEGSPVKSVKTTLGWSSDSLDSAIFPTRGTLQRVTTEIAVPRSDVEYYRLNYTLGRFWPASESTTLKARIDLGYGDGYRDTTMLPFFKNFFAGGSSSVRGYRSSSLGPRDPAVDQPIGGNRRILVNSEFLFPVPGVSQDSKSMRLSLFVDGGMVYGPGERFDLGQLRYSAGLAFNWFSPVGPLSFSYAKPLNEKPGDQKESLQFTLGVPFK
ncbi:MAG TPA: outer membrane protein assembly factor BamA [Burkholderiales bacterium]